MVNDCASARKGQANTAITAIPSMCETFNFFPIMLPPGALKCRVNTKGLKKADVSYHVEMSATNRAVVCLVWRRRTESVAGVNVPYRRLSARGLLC